MRRSSELLISCRHLSADRKAPGRAQTRESRGECSPAPAASIHRIVSIAADDLKEKFEWLHLSFKRFADGKMLREELLVPPFSSRCYRDQLLRTRGTGSCWFQAKKEFIIGMCWLGRKSVNWLLPGCSHQVPGYGVTRLAVWLSHCQAFTRRCGLMMV